MLRKLGITAIFFAGLLSTSALRRWLYVVFCGYEIHRDARIGRAYLDVRVLNVGAGAKIGDFTIVRNMNDVVLADLSHIGTFNWIYGDTSCKNFAHKADRVSSLKLGYGASITSRHIVDCTDKVEIGEFSIVAGYRSQLLTHSIDLKACRQDCAPIVVGRRSFVGTNCVILKGAVVPDKSIISASSVFAQTEEATPGQMWVGTPAVAVKKLDDELGFFGRQSPHIK
ncbi:hypothetical protein R0135_03715 [Congregibacter variabilis]|uniref:Uncharacterized protein n=1 Tax=Congregibacter variabilis TaxID=3081200 RepID=A0ABZ0I5F7_9GAMM|nr:hypothetical protein R0135_03715 [Congregibacter sp. IMCC43200]